MELEMYLIQGLRVNTRDSSQSKANNLISFRLQIRSVPVVPCYIEEGLNISLHLKQQLLIIPKLSLRLECSKLILGFSILESKGNDHLYKCKLHGLKFLSVHQVKTKCLTKSPMHLDLQSVKVMINVSINNSLFKIMDISNKLLSIIHFVLLADGQKTLDT